MNTMVPYLWTIPALPLLASAILALTPRRSRQFAIGVSILALAVSFVLSCVAFIQSTGLHGVPAVFNLPWLEFGATVLRIGWILDPLTAVMLVMVTFVGTLIFVFSVGYMSHDANITRFFCFLSLFAAAMLAVLISNHLLLLFVGWELVGLASYLLIGFWFHKPSAAAAAKKAFITTRVGDLGFFLGMLWLYSETGTLLFYDHGAGCLEANALASLVGKGIGAGMVASTAISLLIFCGAVGKSGQVPLHVWLPDAMEGPTPVSALIHAATMVAAGVFLMARIYPLAAAAPSSGTLVAMAWVGAITALVAALIATTQYDIKRILAYSTVSQLGFMFLGLATGGVAVGMFHLITHAFFKALLFLGAGSVIHGCHEEQDIRRMGGLRHAMPVTYATYAIGMMALSGVPLLFSGFWSKDEILHAALVWPSSKWPFLLAALAALLTAFYMSRQMIYVFFGESRRPIDHGSAAGPAHESPSVMTGPLVVLAVGAVLLGALGTPVWPWFHAYLTGHTPTFQPSVDLGVLGVMLLSTLIVAMGVSAAIWVYGRSTATLGEVDPLQRRYPAWFAPLAARLGIDELYSNSFVRWHAAMGCFCDYLDRVLIGGVIRLFSSAVLALAWIGRIVDEFAVNGSFDAFCARWLDSGRWTQRLQLGNMHHSMRVAAGGLCLLLLWILWKGTA